mgnify:CR=1 FL=1
MTIAEMHVWFRQYAQQMGMQNVRAILPEQIDNLINTSIKDTIDEIVRSNVGTTNDRVITDNSKLANINALRTLYKVKTLSVSENTTIAALGNTPYTFDSSSIGSALYFVDFSVKYTGVSATRWFPIRIIDDSYLADVLNDWVLAPRMRTPVMVVYKAEASGESTLDTAVTNAYNTFQDELATLNNLIETDAQTSAITAQQSVVNAARVAYDTAVANRKSYVDANVELTNFEVYFGENDSINDLASQAKIGSIRCSYIKKPNEVRYVSDIGGTNVDSDLPEQLQIPMLKHAVDLYRASVQGNLFANQENAQQQQRENVRNNARPDNEGYQS